MPRKKKHNRIAINVRWKVPRTMHPETFAQLVREAVDSGDWSKLKGAKVAKMDWSHPDAADTSLHPAKAGDLDWVREQLSGGPEHIDVSVEPVGSHVEKVKKEVPTYHYTYHRLDGRFASHRYRDRYPERVTRHRHRAVRFDYDEIEVPDFEIVVDYDY